MRSLGRPESFALALSRSAFLAVAKLLSIATPETESIASVESLLGWLEVHGCPAYLKADGSSGGTGVRLLTSPSEAERAYMQLHAPPGLLRAAKRTVLDRDPTLLLPFCRRTRPDISVQQHISGQDANSISFCWEGELLATVAVTVLQTRNTRGPSTVVRILEHQAIDEAARRVARAFGLSGFFGLDFLIEEGTGTPYLIELNPRATQITHFAWGEHRDPVSAAFAALTGASPRPRPRMAQQDTIALFPQEWQRDPRSPYLSSAHHDVPWGEPGLLRFAINETPGLPTRLATEKWSLLRSRDLAIPASSQG